MNISDRFLHIREEPALVHVNAAGREYALSYADVERSVGRFAASLQRLGLECGDRVLILGHNEPQTLISILAVMQAGAIAVPIGPLTGDAHILSVIDSMQPTCCILADAPTDAVRASLTECCRLVVVGSRISERTPTNWYNFALLSTLPLSSCARAERDDSERPALLIHTSVSQGTPKSISLTHRRLATFLEWNDYLFSQFSELDSGSDHGNAIVSVLPLYQFAGLALCLQGLMTSRPVYLMSEFAPAAYLRLIARVRCNLIMLAPSMYQALLREPALVASDLPALRFALTLGEPCTPELALQIRDRLGATVVSDPTVHACYLDPALHAERLHEGWFRTHDLFYRDPEGHYFHRGRTDDR